MSVVGSSSSVQGPPRGRLPSARSRRPVVGDRRGHQDQVGAGGPGQGLALELGGGLDLDDLAGGGPDTGVGQERRDPGAAGGGLVGQRRAHAPRGAVAEEADAVERLARPAGGDQDAAAGQRPIAPAAVEHRPDGGVDLGRLAHPPHPPLALGELALGRADDGRAAAAQGLDVLPGRRVVPHADVHRRGHDERAGGGQGALGEDVVGEPEREPGQRVGAARGDAHDGRLAGGVEVRVAAVRLGGVGERGPAGQAREEVGADEALGVGGEDGLDVEPVPEQQPGELGRAVGGDARRDAEQDEATLGHGRQRRARAGRRAVSGGLRLQPARDGQRSRGPLYGLSSHWILPCEISSRAIVR